MKIRSFSTIAFSLLSLALVFFAKVPAGSAGDQVLVPRYTITDETTRSHLEHYCGTSANTSDACNQAYLDCYNAFNAIDNNMYAVCQQRPKDCSYDVTSITMSEEMYTNLYKTPVDNFRNNPTINKIDLCRSENPVGGPRKINQADIDEENRLRAIEAGERGDPAPAIGASAANTAPTLEGAPAVNNPPALEGSAAVNNTAASAPVQSAGGCSLQIAKTPAKVPAH